MKFTEISLKGAFVIEPELIKDDRGFFSRIWCEKEFKAHGLDLTLAQISIAFNNKKGTIRGMHFQLPPYEEVKLVRCTSGAIYDVIVDLRKDSSTFKQWYSTEVSAKNHKILYIPKGFAHGYQTLEDNTEVIYHMSEFFIPNYYSGVRWNDPAFKIKWPFSETIIISEKDKSYKDFKS